MNYQEKNAEIINTWCTEGWQWGQPITQHTYEEVGSLFNSHKVRSP